MGRQESLQIELVRVLCILCMMWVHVSPGFSFETYVNGGPMDVVGLFLGRTLGRISVTTLSFISGYLFWRTAAYRPWRPVLRRVLAGLFLPFLVWSALFLLLAVFREQFIGQPSTALERVAPGFWGQLNAWAGLTGPTANLSLFFIRDLIVASLILRLSVPLVARQPAVAVGLALIVATVLPQTAPVLFRPNILLFMVLGAVAARQGATISSLSRPRYALVGGLLLTLLTVLMAKSGLTERLGIESAHDLLRRAGIGLLMLALTRVLLRRDWTATIARLGRHGFLAYLIHAPLAGTVWVLWQAAIGDADDPSYLFFYLGTPPLCLALAAGLGCFLDNRSQPLQLLLRGKIYRGGGAPSASGQPA